MKINQQDQARSIVVFAGTTEGRKLAEFLAKRGVLVHACVATSYGESLLGEYENLTVSSERMDRQQMTEMLKQICPVLVVDATHPYAKEVTENIRSACEECQVEYLRCLRESVEAQNGIVVEDTAAAVEYLRETTGNILLTTGSKELAAYQSLPDYRNRLYARVLSTKEVVEKCVDLGIEGKHLICMQGPFSTELNLAMIRDLDISYLVTKESGQTGGFSEKMEAAAMAGVKPVVIGRPVKEEGYSFGEIIRRIKEHVQFADRWDVTIAGIGPGDPEQMTVAVQKAIRDADLVLGAGRMLQTARMLGIEEVKLVSAYKPDRVLEEIRNHPECEHITVLMSGDVGFYSGTKRLLAAFNKEQGIQIKVLTGISSVPYFASKIGVSWDDARILSMHGKDENLAAYLLEDGKVFSIISNGEMLKEKLCELSACGLGECKAAVGTNLSYENERIVTGSVEKLSLQTFDSLGVLFVEKRASESGEKAQEIPRVQESPNVTAGMSEESEASVRSAEISRTVRGLPNCKKVTPGIPDESFLRGNVPMTKEEVRTISLSKLNLKKGDILYDIGAGTGSVSVEMAKAVPSGQIFAVETNPEAVELIRENAKWFHLTNIHVVEGMAPEAMEDLPAPHGVFIGGSKGNLKEILATVKEKNPHARVVVNAITLETMAETLRCMQEFAVAEEEILQVSIQKARNVGKYHMMGAQNPIWIAAFTM